MKKILFALSILIAMESSAIADQPGYFTLGKSKLDGGDVLAPSYFTLGKSKLGETDALAPSYFTLDKSKLDGGDILAPNTEQSSPVKANNASH
jgi:hypothetical protein